MKKLTVTHRDETRHEIVQVNLLRSTSKVVDTVVGARRVGHLLEVHQRRLTPAQIARGDSYAVKSRSPLGSLRRLALN
jgi:hypothetical protein